MTAPLKANKDFDMLVIPGGSHGAGRSAEHPEYGERKRCDFFVQHLLGQRPPNWNAGGSTTRRRAPTHEAGGNDGDEDDAKVPGRISGADGTV